MSNRSISFISSNKKFIIHVSTSQCQHSARLLSLTVYFSGDNTKTYQRRLFGTSSLEVNLDDKFQRKHQRLAALFSPTTNERVLVATSNVHKKLFLNNNLSNIRNQRHQCSLGIQQVLFASLPGKQIELIHNLLVDNYNGHYNHPEEILTRTKCPVTKISTNVFLYHTASRRSLITIIIGNTSYH